MQKYIVSYYNFTFSVYHDYFYFYFTIRIFEISIRIKFPTKYQILSVNSIMSIASLAMDSFIHSICIPCVKLDHDINKTSYIHASEF